MSRELMILRHGKSDWDVDVDDFHRPLQERGRRGAQRMGNWLLQQKLLPDRVVSSPAERAIATAGQAVKAMGLATSIIVQDERIYAAGLGSLMDVLRSVPAETKRLMLVGHNPGLEQLLSYLVEEEVPIGDDGKLLPTATLARLTLDCAWSAAVAGCARLESITRPGMLPEPGSAAPGGESRERPDYYYAQSSVIPYRLQSGRPEILVISSNSKKHLIVPKGINEPGLTQRQSAAKEAREEAGVEGVVGAESLGRYSYRKWGGVCTVDVYPMEVTKVLPEEEWEESYRGRNWVSPERAAKALKQRELAVLVKKLAARLTENS
ncbi:MAG: histidine phosphatase family protein [Gammaproteobacteria bacterium]|nr:histidine phosphatase family protein [Gammaproteobacteria bacterium]HXK56372.1 histidine phosphatase family protein [Gammaproteobacteria bacterium]